LLLSEKLSVLGLLAGAVAHDIQNPLAVIMGNAEILLAKFPQNEHVSYGAKTIVRQSERITDLVDSIQNYSRGNADVFEFVDIHRILREALMLTERLLNKFQVRLELRFDSTLAPVFGNANRLEQVFMNLIQNAAQAMEKQGGGCLVLTTRKTNRVDGEWVEVLVSDTGGGVPPEKEKDVFKTFFTTKSHSQGSGLGLAICQRIIRAHYGELILENHPGAGATFVVRIATKDIRDQGHVLDDRR
jgi:signal transduction histidine kinase